MKKIKGYSNYRIAADGKVLNTSTGKYLTPTLNKQGCLCVGLYLGDKQKMFGLHRLVAIHFVRNPKKLPQVKFKNGIKTDISPQNLEWTVRVANVKTKRCINTITGEVLTIAEAAAKLKMPKTTFYGKLSGDNKNNTSYKFL